MLKFEKSLMVSLVLFLYGGCGSAFADIGTLTKQADIEMLMWSGNTEKTILGQGITVSYQRENTIIGFQEGYNYGKSQGKNDLEKFNLLVKYRKEINDKTSISSNIEYTKDEIKDTKRLQAKGIKINQDYFHSTHFKFSKSIGVVLERVVVGEEGNDLLRLFIEKGFILNLSEINLLAVSLSYQPKLFEINNYLLQANIDFKTKISNRTGIFLNIKSDYDSKSKRRKNDIIMENGISVKW